MTPQVLRVEEVTTIKVLSKESLVVFLRLVKNLELCLVM